MWSCHSIGDRCWSFRCAEAISAEASRRVLFAYRKLKAAALPGVVDVVPAYTEVAVHFDPLQVSAHSLRDTLECFIRELDESDPYILPDAALHRIPVVYDGEDLERVSRHTGLAIGDVIHRHAAGRYSVAMIGFLPHFPYCLGLDQALVTPRLDAPRKRVPAGSVALAGEQTGIYPQCSPGGWNLVGRTDPARLDSIRPGDQLVFEPVETLR
jgi:inhibitor of KinA